MIAVGKQYPCLCRLLSSFVLLRGVGKQLGGHLADKVNPLPHNTPYTTVFTACLCYNCSSLTSHRSPCLSDYLI